MTEIIDIPIDKIKADENEQRIDAEDDEIASLAASIVRVGMVNPIMVCDHGGDYTIVAGHRRYQAARRAGCRNVPCIVTTSKKELAAEITFAENFFRKDLSPVELACAIKDSYEKGTLTVKELADGFNRTEHWVQRMMSVADWPVDVLEAVHNERISVSAASNLVCVTDDDYRNFLVRNAVENGATARTTASWLQAWRAMQPQEEAITSEPVDLKHWPIPLVPQAPCLCCGQIFPVNEMSHVPICGPCIQIIRQAGMSQGV